jgi:hypothetical protein
MKSLPPIVCLSLLASVLTAFGANHNVSHGGLGPLEQFLSIGESGGWTGTMDNGTYWMENTSDAGAIRYYFTGVSGNTGSRIVSVDVNARGSTESSRAGLLYGYRESPKSYFLLVVSGDGMFEVYQRGANGLQLKSGSSFDLSESGFQTIQVGEEGRKLSFSVNGRNMGTLESDAVGSGALGIAAMGLGSFGFSNYREQSSGEGAARSPVPSSTETPTVSGTAAVFREHVVRDTGRNNLPAYRLLVPKGWEVEGDITPAGQALFRIPYLGHVKVKAPDQRFVTFFPFMEFGYNDQVQGGFMQAFDGRFFARLPENLGQFVLSLSQLGLDDSVSGLRIISEEIVPDATEYVRSLATAQYQQAQTFNNNAGFTGQRYFYDRKVHKLVAEYSLDGVPMREVTFATMSTNVVTFPNGSVKAGMWSLDNMYSVGGPVGQDHLTDPELAAIIRSRRINPDWAYALDMFYANQRNIIIKEGIAKAAAARGTWSNTRSSESEDILDISFNGWKKRNAMSDAGQSRTVDSILERTPYATSSGESVYLPSYYQNAYTDGQGNYVLHNDANYQINTDPNFNSRNWERMTEVR